jgi:hypothetical protein
MICPTCGHYTTRAHPQVKAEGLTGSMPCTVGIRIGADRWEEMSELAKKVIMNDLARQRKCAT